MSTDLMRRLRELATWADGFHQTGLGALLSSTLREAADALPQWQDIETAPIDQGSLLVADADGYVVEAYYDDDRDGWWEINVGDDPGRYGHVFPTHWMFKPAPPEGEQP